MYQEDFDNSFSQEKSGDDIYSKPVRAGKRTYFFDVKATKNNDYYLTITESKRKVEKDGRFSYDKHKIFLYKEDFEKVSKGLTDAINYVETGEYPADYYDQPETRRYDNVESESHSEIDSAIDKWFDNLDK